MVVVDGAQSLLMKNDPGKNVELASLDVKTRASHEEQSVSQVANPITSGIWRQQRLLRNRSFAGRLIIIASLDGIVMIKEH